FRTLALRGARHDPSAQPARYRTTPAPDRDISPAPSGTRPPRRGDSAPPLGALLPSARRWSRHRYARLWARNAAWLRLRLRCRPLAPAPPARTELSPRASIPRSHPRNESSPENTASSRARTARISARPRKEAVPARNRLDRPAQTPRRVRLATSA